VARQQRKPRPEAVPPPRRTAIPRAANDNRAGRRAAIAIMLPILAAFAYVAYRALA
jgi:hypothetical protein